MPSPGPRPNQPPERMLCSAVSTWKVSTRPPVEVRIEKAQHALVHVRRQFEHGEPAGHAHAPDGDDPEPMQAGQKEERRPHDRDQHRLAEVGLEDERHNGDGQEQEGEKLRPNCGRARAPTFGEGPGGKNDKRRLDELRWLEAKDPAPRPFDLRSEHERKNDERERHGERHQRRAPHVPRREKRSCNHQRRRRDQHQSLTVDKVEGRKIEPLRHRRTCRQRHHEADHHERDERPDQPSVRSAHPIRNEAAFHPRNHEPYLPVSMRVPAAARS